MTTATEDQITQEIRVDWQSQPQGTPKGYRWTRIGKPGLKYHARRAKRNSWLHTALIEVAAALIFLITTIGAGIFYYPLLADWLDGWAILTCAVCAVTYGIITIASVKILKDW